MPKTVMVFSHPNHEIALWSTIRRLQPILIFLTDGGGQHRINQSINGLSPIINMASVHFLNHPEHKLYDALLNHDLNFLNHLSSQICSLIGNSQPDAIYCDSVEFYNPVHDLSLPLVQAALPHSRVPIYEVPLVHQTSSTPDNYEILRAPTSLAESAIWHQLPPEDVRAKKQSFTSHYSILFEHLGATLAQQALFNSSREQVFPARTSLPEPAAGQILRYEWRGQLLKQQGQVSQVIGYKEHYVPAYKKLLHPNYAHAC